MKNKFLWIITFLPAFITLIAIQFMEDLVPMHYDLTGNIDRWGSKYENFLFPAFIIIMSLIWVLVINILKKKLTLTSDDKKLKELEQNIKILHFTAIGMALLFGIMHCAFLYSAFVEAKKQMTSMAIDVNIIINVAFGLLLIFLGNIIPKSKPNSLVGLRTVWSLKNDITWAKSNRMGGIALIIAGILIIIEAVLIGGPISVLIAIGILIASTIFASVYSYKVSTRYPGND